MLNIHFRGWNQWDTVGVCSMEVYTHAYCVLYVCLNIICMSISVVLYAQVLRQACRQLRRVTQQVERFHNHDSRLRQEVARSKVMWVILGVFIMCWLPFTLLSPLPFFIDNSAIIQAREVALSFGILNSALNCIIYGLRSREFQTGVRLMMENTTCLQVLCPRPRNVRVVPSSSDTAHSPPSYISDH